MPFIQIKIPDRRPPAMPTAGGQGGLVRNDGLLVNDHSKPGVSPYASTFPSFRRFLVWDTLPTAFPREACRQNHATT
ncbi:MAG: hypothetical protein AAFW89_08390 [Bacteroidota bacterium]